MIVEQLYTGCLAEAAYYIESEGEAAIIDPLRDPEPYIAMAKRNGARIVYVLETHFHADFVSGHLDLARKTGAEIVYGPTAKPNFDAHIAADGEVLELGRVRIKVLHTPGHTMESSCFLLLDEAGREHGIFSGDTLFIGDVGRPDLAVKTDLSREDLAGHLFDSLRGKVMPLPDSVIVYPGHGAGSACGKMMSKETFDTLGHQKKINYALRADMSREEFIREVTTGLAPPPQYFPKNAVMNKAGYESFEDVRRRGVVALDVEAFENVVQHHKALILDTRSGRDFAGGFIPGSVFIGLDGNFAMWVGALIADLKQNIVFIADEGREEEVVMRLARVGYDMARGYLLGGIEAWQAAGRDIETLDQVTAAEFARRYQSNPDLNVLDVRKASEFTSEHLEGAANFPLDLIHGNIGQLAADRRYYLHCLSGYRSVIAASLLKKQGINDVVDVMGGYKALAQTALKRSQLRAPATML